MSGGLLPGPTPSAAQLRRAMSVRRALERELDRVREVAVAWRNGLGAILAGLVGFSLIKGRSDVGQLAPGWSTAAGLLLLAALCVGGAGALCLLRAAHGRPYARRLSEADDASGRPLEVQDHDEALASARFLHTGIVLTCLCTTLLVSAVGVTWYAPAKSPPGLMVRQGATSVCGEVVSARRGTVVLKVDGVTTTVNLSQADSVTPVASCPGPAPAATG
ncbi:hypothetical protein BJ965_006998 [Streptomyces luteogriseus]|uniref:Uncharacterized protein n=1 Tax=Streptomyces luteogriseus TaxID=68233 RepID=A0A7W7DUW9_9ACTN|nr:hypothetical protein [Streptomyces luteogriseus]MBB4717116.1 hypothetical protein [Streptomyces luteogriseus]